MDAAAGSLEIHELSSDALVAALDDFVALSQRVVLAGAHLGWNSPLDAELAADYWRARTQAIDHGEAILFAGYAGGDLVATVQLERSYFPTSRHRGEVAKLLVDPRMRRRRFASLMMDALETRAIAAGIELLVLDTRPGEPVEQLYSARGYTRTGLVPHWMKYATGEYKGTVFYYKILGAGEPAATSPTEHL